MNARHHAHPYPPPGVIISPSEGRGWAYVYPLPEEPSHKEFERDEVPGRYDVATSGKVRDGEGT